MTTPLYRVYDAMRSTGSSGRFQLYRLAINLTSPTLYSAKTPVQQNISVALTNAYALPQCVDYRRPPFTPDYRESHQAPFG